MKHSGKDKPAQVIEGQVMPACPPPKLPRLRLGTLREVRREMAKVYEEVRRLKLPSQEGTRLIYMLTAISNQIRDTELEQRIEKLEKASEEFRTKNRTT
ncbi:hypothetical protein [Nitrosomonas sp. Is37]|uniref:hypothetical protein n=1 Tax=Nitrosomonas sp. Is37 TaxID=3080535 RepID=UPI00294B5766|nr:hypothetical protein [Nitrosomonas sp. Is37]MDV6345404.1 hypothetical protein [Nitrosomonas sp. Is37]